MQNRKMCNTTLHYQRMCVGACGGLRRCKFQRGQDTNMKQNDDEERSKKQKNKKKNDNTKTPGSGSTNSLGFSPLSSYHYFLLQLIRHVPHMYETFSPRYSPPSGKKKKWEECNIRGSNWKRRTQSPKGGGRQIRWASRLGNNGKERETQRVCHILILLIPFSFSSPFQGKWYGNKKEVQD